MPTCLALNVQTIVLFHEFSVYLPLGATHSFHPPRVVCLCTLAMNPKEVHAAKSGGIQRRGGGGGYGKGYKTNSNSVKTQLYRGSAEDKRQDSAGRKGGSGSGGNRQFSR